jgi:thiamine-monophosphate kinase
LREGLDAPALIERYRNPRPRLEAGERLVSLVRAMMDVSDGLLIDAARMAEAGGLSVEIDLAAVPLSADLRAHAGESRAIRLAAATAGDDYALLFAAPPAFVPPVPARCIGAFTAGAGLTLRDGTEMVTLPPRLGFEHAG